VDAYFGPPEWREQAAAAGRRPITELAREADDLAVAIAGTTAMNAQRLDYLERQVRAMRTSLRLLQGECLSLGEEVEGLYDITPEWTDEAVFEEAHRALDELLPSGGTLAERLIAKKRETEISVARAASVLGAICDELRRRTQARFPLPEGESFEVQFVSGQPWGAYNWYLGGYRSRIDINTDLPLQVAGLSELLAHEGYAGHHTELSIKESLLVRGFGWSEHCVALINSPSCVVAEGIAVRAREIIMSDDELIAWHADDLFPRAGFHGLDARREHALIQARRKLAGADGNAAFLLHDQGATENEVIAYLQRYTLRTPEEARKMLAFLTAPLSRSYIFTYNVGGDMLDALFAARGERERWFARLLTEPVTPGQIQAWTQGVDR
jgi:hypothetical protein